MDVLGRAAERGYRLDEKPLNGRWVWAWHRGDDWRHPSPVANATVVMKPERAASAIGSAHERLIGLY
jgi:hypothetical protein